MDKKTIKENLRIWGEVEDTDMNYTSRVQAKCGFIAIQAQYQLRKATELWGPMGIGWQVVTEYREVPLANGEVLVVADLELHYRDEAGPNGGWAKVEGIAAAYKLASASSSGLKVDTDAYKKARTDAMTKALSQLGFSADVFLGLKDPNVRPGKVAAEEQRRQFLTGPAKKTRKKKAKAEATPPAEELPF